jgi:hypothetical protein
MEEATAHIRALARRVTDAALELGPLRGALLAGSGARGECDFYSDVDLLLYVDEPPPEGRLEALRDALGGDDPVVFAPQSVQFRIGGVAVQVSYTTVAEMERRLDAALDRLEEIVGTPNQKMLAGLLEGLPLQGDELIAGWRGRVADYPDALRRAMVEQHWRVFPLWYFARPMAVRDAELWRLDVLLDAAFDLLGVLAGLNRVYYARFELKRLRAFVAKLALAPPDLADRLESLFRLPAAEAADELGRLVAETRDLVQAELPDLDLPLRHPPGTHLPAWTDPGF